MRRPEIVDAFTASVAPYGPGTTVQLSDGRYGIVSSINPAEPTRPGVRVTHDADGMRFVPPMDVSLSKDPELSIKAATRSLPGDGDATA